MYGTLTAWDCYIVGAPRDVSWPFYMFGVVYNSPEPENSDASNLC